MVVRVLKSMGIAIRMAGFEIKLPLILLRLQLLSLSFSFRLG